MGDDVAQENDLHEAARIGNGLLAGSEEIKDGVEEYQTDNGEQKADEQVERHGISKQRLCREVILLPKFDGDGR